jgi:hypothetical protein
MAIPANGQQMKSTMASLMGAIVLVPALYLPLDGPRTIQSYLLLAPQTQRESISDLISVMESKVGFYMIGQAFL